VFTKACTSASAPGGGLASSRLGRFVYQFSPVIPCLPLMVASGHGTKSLTGRTTVHITHTLGHLRGGRSRRAVATLIVAFCATLALTVSTPVPASATPTGSPPSQICCNTVLTAALNERIVSPNGRFELRMQSDGNLVLYLRSLGNPYYALWNSHTWGIGAELAAMQSDGNFVIYRGNTPLWNSNTAGHPYATLVMQNDGNAVIYHNGVALWSTGTGGWPARIKAASAMAAP
jgi:hypothetical protein